MGENQIPFALIYTKSDKSKPRIVQGNIESIQQELLKEWEYLPEQFITSASNGQGIEQVLEYLHTLVDGIHTDEGK